MRELAPQFQIPWSIPLEAEDIPIVPTTSGTMYVKDTHCFKLSDSYITSVISVRGIVSRNWKFLEELSYRKPLPSNAD